MSYVKMFPISSGNIDELIGATDTIEKSLKGVFVLTENRYTEVQNGADHCDNAARALARARPMALGRWRTGRWSARRLTARVMRDGVLLYLQYFFPDTGKLPRMPLGPFDEPGTRGPLRSPGPRQADELAALYRRGAKERNAHLERAREAAQGRRRGLLARAGTRSTPANSRGVSRSQGRREGWLALRQ